MRRSDLAFLVLLVLVACGEKATRPAAREPGPDAIGALCHMALAEHRGPKAQLFLKGSADPLWFSSVRDLFAWLRDEGAGKAIAAIYVNDMAQGDWDHPAPGSWVDARLALFVVGSDRGAEMGGAEMVPFGAAEAAARFIAAHGGHAEHFKDLS